jgi:hypothetical protein
MINGEGTMEEKVQGEMFGAEKHSQRAQARQEGRCLRIEAGRTVQRDEQEQAALNRERRGAQFKWKRYRHLKQMEQGVNTLRLNNEQMRKI